MDAVVVWIFMTLEGPSFAEFPKPIPEGFLHSAGIPLPPRASLLLPVSSRFALDFDEKKRRRLDLGAFLA
jgi:hypothetical protein